MPNHHSFTPYIPATAQLPELTLRAVLMGAVLGIIFGASSLYLVLKVGLTVSASIPVAVISLSLFRLGARLGFNDASILENNIAQTTGSAGESIAFGIGVTMPAILLLGFELELLRIMLVAAMGALLGILMMIPLRRALIVQQHTQLRYPEGTACAAVLQAGASAQSQAAAHTTTHTTLNARIIFTGFGIGFIYKTCMTALKLWKEIPAKVFTAPLKGTSLACEISPELLGVGYIIGPAIAATMFAGGVLAYWVLIPMIKFFGSDITGALPPGTLPIADMSVADIRSAYVLYIGAGAVAAGGIISMLRSLPTIWHSIKVGVDDFSTAFNSTTHRARTDRDLPLSWVLAGIVALTLGIISTPTLHMNLLGAVLLLVFGFLFVTVSSRLTGEIGQSSNPVSGMTIATLLLTCVIFLSLGWTARSDYVTALTVGGIVCVAAANAGATSQDLKTGFLLGATPNLQQYAIMIGSLVAVLTLGPVLLVLNSTATTYVPIAQVAPAGLHADTQINLEWVHLQGPQANTDPAAYHSWYKMDDIGGPAGQYLVRPDGQAVWYVDPGINGRFSTRPDGSEVRKYDAPKATLMAYIIRGVLNHELPWSLVLLGALLAVVVELCGVSSLPFAVGVYLPLSSAAPIFVGGMVRAWIERRQTSSNTVQSQDHSPGVLLASGYIAGGAIAGIIVAFMAGVFDSTDAQLTDWATLHNPFFAGAWSDTLALLPFVILTILLLRVARMPADAHNPSAQS